MGYRLAKLTDDRALRDLSARTMSEPDFDIYPRHAMSLTQYRKQVDDGQWEVYEQEGKLSGIVWIIPSLKYGPRETFHTLAFYTDPLLDIQARRIVGLHMIVGMAKTRLAAGYRFGDFELPVNNWRIKAFAEDVEPEPYEKRVSGTDPVTGKPHYHLYVWDLEKVLVKAEKLLAVVTRHV